MTALKTIRVKAVAGRIARNGPSGELIPDDRYVTVDETPYMKRLINHHGDVTVEPEKKPAPVKAPVEKETPNGD